MSSKNSNLLQTSYTYDRLGRLVSEEQEDDYGETHNYIYTYDNVGNRIKLIDNDSEGDNLITTYTYDATNRLISTSEYLNVTNPTRYTNTAYTYDNNGNMLSKAVSTYNSSTGVTTNNTSLARTYTYDGFNRLITVKNSSNTNVAQYTYYSDSLRKTKTVNGVTTNYINNDGNVIMALDTSGNVTEDYMYGVNRERKLSDSEYSYFISDGQGSIILHLDDEGNNYSTTPSWYRYDAYGQSLTGNSSSNQFRYRGEFSDNETGFIYLRGRYYNPDTGSFISEDPVKDGSNWYAYCGGDPVNFVDPSGLKNVIAIAGSDYSSNDNVFLNDIDTYISDHSDDNIKVFKGWEYNNWKKMKKDISNAFDKEKIDEIIIAAHSDFEKIILSNDYMREGRPNIYINKRTSWHGIKLSDDSNIIIMGCNAGGMAGQSNMKAEIAYNENGDFSNYTGKMIKADSIAQIIANKTKSNVSAFTNYTSQAYINGGYYQVPVDNHGESNMQFTCTTGMWWWKKTITINGTVNDEYTKFEK